MQFSSTTRASDQGTPGARSAATDVGDNVQALREDISSLADSVKRLATEQLGSSVGDVQDMAKEKISDIEASIRRNPSQAALDCRRHRLRLRPHSFALTIIPGGIAMSSQYTNTPRNTASGTNRQVNDLANTAQDKFNETVEQAQALAQEQYDKMAASIRRNPLQAAGIAAGIGFVLALLARR